MKTRLDAHGRTTRAVGAVLAAAALTTGCSSSGSSTSTGTPAAPVQQAPVQQAPVEQAPVEQAPVPAALPAGQVPREVVGRWSGGEGDRTGEYLIVTADGRYARGRNQSDPYRAGVIVAQGRRFVAYDIDGSREAGTWEYTNAAGIEVLGVYFGGDYYSYARA